MKKSQIKAALEALRTVRMTKVSDKEVRNALISNHMVLFDDMDKYGKQAKKLEAVYLGAFEDDRKKVGQIQNEFRMETDPKKKNEILQKLNGDEFKELNKAWEVYADEMNKLGNEEVVGLKPIDREKFIAAVADAEIEFQQLEALYPMLASAE